MTKTGCANWRIWPKLLAKWKQWFYNCEEKLPQFLMLTTKCLLLRGNLCIGWSAWKRKISIASLLQKASWMKITSRFKKKYKKYSGASRNFERLVWHYFPTAQEKVLDDFQWVLNMFSVNKKPACLNSAEYAVLKDLASRSELKIAFQNQSLPEFWLCL